jgi:hypothetical protein
MSRVGFKCMTPAFEQVKTVHALDCMATVIGSVKRIVLKYWYSKLFKKICSQENCLLNHRSLTSFLWCGHPLHSNTCTVPLRHFELCPQTVLVFCLVINRWQPYVHMCSSLDHRTHKTTTVLITNITDLNPSCQAASCADIQELPSILWNLKVHYWVHNSTTLQSYWGSKRLKAIYTNGRKLRRDKLC